MPSLDELPFCESHLGPADMFPRRHDDGHASVHAEEPASPQFHEDSSSGSGSEEEEHAHVRPRRMSCIALGARARRNSTVSIKAQRRVSFSQSPPAIAEMHSIEDYNREVLEGVDDNFRGFKLMLIKMDLAKLKTEMKESIHPDAPRTSRGLDRLDPELPEESLVLGF